jgi:hypothetical protein
MPNASLSSDGNTVLRRRGTDTVIHSLALVLLVINLIHTRLPVQEAALLYRTSALKTSRAPEMDVTIAAAALACVADAWG